MVETSQIAKIFVKKSKNAQKAAEIFTKASSIPTTASGGIRATAIATPASPLQSLVYFILITQIIPEKRAIKKSIKFGFVLASISEVSSSNQMNLVAVNAKNIERKKETNIIKNDFLNMSVHHLAME